MATKTSISLFIFERISKYQFVLLNIPSCISFAHILYYFTNISAKCGDGDGGGSHLFCSLPSISVILLISLRSSRLNSIYPIFESSKSVHTVNAICVCCMCLCGWDRVRERVQSTSNATLSIMLNYIYDQYARCNKYINRIFVYYHFNSTFL